MPRFGLEVALGTLAGAGLGLVELVAFQEYYPAACPACVGLTAAAMTLGVVLGVHGGGYLLDGDGSVWAASLAAVVTLAAEWALVAAGGRGWFYWYGVSAYYAAFVPLAAVAASIVYELSSRSPMAAPAGQARSRDVRGTLRAVLGWTGRESGGPVLAIGGDF